MSLKHEVTSLQTKKTLAASLKRLMAQKPFSKISVSDIVADCGVNRKTFYYHFEDLYALLKWMFEQETIEVVKNFDFLMNPEEAILFVMNYVDENQHIINCAYNAMGRDEIKRFFFADFNGVMRRIIDDVEREHQITVDEKFKNFLSCFYTEALAGILIAYFREPREMPKEKIVEDTIFILHSALPNTLIERSKQTKSAL
jgi:probable dihydroxyacetone kinase regulator